VALDDGDADVFRADADGDHHDDDHDGEHSDHGGHRVAQDGEARE
jgi:hypothetical protein